jgi:uncharacterized Fe-S cluster protein YjdI
MAVKKYTNGEVTITWKPDICIHSTLCWKGMREVFDPKKRPWITPEGSTTENIITQVQKCPSGALSYFMNADTTVESTHEPEEKVTGEAHITQIEILHNGPIAVNNECIIKFADGREETRKGRVTLCRCGGSSNKPFCDGSHRRNGFEG